MLVLPLATGGQENSVQINEIAWMGTVNSSSDEWIELYNTGSEEVDLTGWILESTDGTPLIDITQKSLVLPPVLLPGGFFLLERTDDTTLPNIGADVIYVGALGNGGEKLVLKDSNGNIIDTVDGLDNWKINGSSTSMGSNETKETAQKIGNNWITATATPRLANNSGSEQEEPSVTPPVLSSLGAPLVVQAKAPEDIVVMAREEITLDASLSSDAVEFKWYLGDGSFKEGKIIKHTYNFPGQYLVTLEASNSGQTSIDQLNIFVFDGRVLINEIFIPATTTVNSWVELYNPTETPIDLDGWVLEVSNKDFIFPSYTLILTNSFLVLSEKVTKLRPSKDSTIRLSFPNRVLVDEVILQNLKIGQSAARQNEEFFWTKDFTPGASNRIVSGNTIFNNIVKKSTQMVSEKETPIGKNLITASSYNVREPEKTEKEQEKIISASMVTAKQDNNVKNNLFVWLILTMSFSFVVSVTYILFLRRKVKTF